MIDLPNPLSEFPETIANADWTAAGDSLGYSGSNIWRGRAWDGREFALKRYSQQANANELRIMHAWMKIARDHGLEFVPDVYLTRSGTTVVSVRGRLWDVTTWMPGVADFHRDPSDVKLLAAVEALSRIHLSWERGLPSIEAEAPSVRRRASMIELAADLSLRNDLQGAEFRDALSVIERLRPAMGLLIQPWLGRPMPLQPCIGDIWNDHVLFEGDRVTGVIDFAAAKYDTPAADLARLLGSMIPDDRERTMSAVDRYSAIATRPNAELVDALDKTGVFGAATNWLHRFSIDPALRSPRNLTRFHSLANRLAAF